MSKENKDLNRSKLIARSGLCFLIVIISHYLVTTTLPDSKRLPERGPIVAAQKFILQEKTPRCVIVGSSFADRLDPFNTDPETTMITINGGSSFDGLALIKERSSSQTPPKIIAIEINRLIIYDEKEWVTKLLSETNKKIWKSTPFLRDYNRPLSILGWPIHTGFNKLYLTVTSKLPLFKTTDAKSTELQDRFNRNIAGQKEYLEAGIEDDKISSITSKLREYVKEFSDRGAHIILFCMPIHPDLEKLETPRKLLAGIKNGFPAPEFSWLENVDAAEYEYTDGIHLAPKSAEKYYTILTDKITGIEKNER